MPVYNGEKYIRKALDSLLSQTFSDFELIISDNASTDTTQAICEEYCKCDKRISYFRQSVNIGAINNFLYVLNRSSCAYFMWVSCDDLWDKNWVEILLNNMNSETAISFGRVIEIWPDGSINKVYPAMSFPLMAVLRVMKLLWLDAPNKAMLVFGLFHRKYFNSLKGNMALKYFVPIDMYIELYFIYKIAHDGNIITTDSTSLYKRLGGASSSHLAGIALHAHRPASLSTLGFSKFVKRGLDALNPVNLIKYNLLYINVPSPLYMKLLVLLMLPFVVLKHYLMLGRYVIFRINNIFKLW